VSKTFYHPDHLGSTIGLTDQETTKVWDRTYLPYGGTFTGTGTTENTHQYTAKELEAATGLYYYGARYHNPNIGRFMSVDPAGADPTDPQSWNRYAYVLNNPYKYVDPDGSMECSVIPEGVETSPSGTCGAIGGGGGRQLALPPGPKQLALPRPSSIKTSQSSFLGSFIERLNRVIFKGAGVNITPRSVANTYRIIGKGNRTFVTNVETVENIIGPLKGDKIRISSSQARQLEDALGIKENSLESRNIISVVDGIATRSPGSPIEGNEYFLGGGKGLPGGRPELTISGINSAGGGGIRQIILEVVE
jgi:RHS repeat-associated protein